MSDPDVRNPEALAAARWRVIGLLVLISFTNYFNRICMPVAGERIMHEYAIDEVRMGWVYSAMLIIYTACMIPGGWLSDRLGGWRTLILMGLGTAAATGLTGLAGHPALPVAMVWPALLVARGLMGVFTSPVYPAAGRVVTHWVPFSRRALVNGLVTGAGMVGIALAHPLFAELIAASDWRRAFGITAALTAALTGLWWWFGRDDPTARVVTSLSAAADQPASWLSLARRRSVWLLTLSYGTVGYVEYLVFYWSGHYFKQVLGFSSQEGQLAAMLPPLLMALTMPLGGALADRLMGPLGYRWARATVGLGGMLVCGLLVCAGTWVSSTAAIVACFVLALGAIGLSEGAAWPTAIDLGGPRGATSAAIVNTGGNLGGSLAPVVTPWVGALLAPSLGRTIGWAWGVRLGGLFCLLGGLLWFWIDAADRAPNEAADPEASSPSDAG
jgi:ACS family glucarate transporter-like MFS transporter